MLMLQVERDSAAALCGSAQNALPPF